MTGAVVEQLTFHDRAKVVSDQVLGKSKTAGYGTPGIKNFRHKKLFFRQIDEGY